MTVGPSRPLVVAACVAPVALFFVIYLVLPFHGFMIDDYGWILHSRVRGFGDLARLFTETTGFYRPIVGLSFALDEALFGNAAFGYATTNVMLAMACGAAIAWLGRAVGLTRGTAIFMACLWLLNFQGIRTAVLWVSGRSALLVTLTLTLSAASLLRGRWAASITWLTLALLSKEEAIVFPVVLTAWLLMLGRRRPKSVGWVLLGFAAVTAGYVLARQAAGAFTPATAPDYYRFTLVPRVIWRHAYIYSDQILTFSLIVTVVAMALLRPSRPFLDRRTGTIAMLGGVWVLGGYALTILVPSRSDLYACLPSVGVCLTAAAICERAWAQSPAVRQTRALVAVLLACVVLSPVYYLRTQTRANLMAFGASALSEIERAVAPLPPDSLVTVFDDAEARDANRPNLEDAFAGQLSDAYEMATGRRLGFDIRVPGDAPPSVDSPRWALVLRDGHIRTIVP